MEPPIHPPYRSREVAKCPLCGHSGEVLHRGITDRTYGVPGESDILRCAQCGAGWLNPAPVPEDFGKCYVGAYYTHEREQTPAMGSSKRASILRGAVLSARKGYDHLRPDGAGSILGPLLMHVPAVWKRASWSLDELLLTYRKGGRLLEIGCGSGSYLAIMRMLGWDVRGLDVDPAAAEEARAAANCPVHVGTVEEAPFREGSFDAIASSHVIEHVDDPKSFVAASARLLTKGGVMVVRTPNFQSLGHKLFGTDWFSLDPPRHLCLFTPDSLRDLFRASGAFREIRTKTVTYGSRMAIRRRAAVRATGNFLSDVKTDWRGRLAERLFIAAEWAGDGIFHWGEEVECTAIRS